MDDKGAFEMDNMGGTQNKNLRTQVPLSQQTAEEDKPQSEVCRSTTNVSYIKTQCLAAMAMSLGSLIAASSYRYGVLALSKIDINLAQLEWRLWLDLLAPIIGGVLCVPLFELLGRKMTILVTSIPLIILWLLSACTMNGWTVLVGCSIARFVSRVAKVSFRVYLVETTQPEVRGILCLLPSAFDSIAILLWAVAKRYMNWLAVAYLSGTLSVLFLILLVLVPETPHWYVLKGKKESARKSLQWMRGKKADVESELEDILKSRDNSEIRRSNAFTAQLFKKCNIKPLLISLGLIFFQQFSGIHFVWTYLYRINFDYEHTEYAGGASFAATLIAMVLVDRLGRKKLLYISSVGMIVTLGALGGFYYVEESGYSLSHIEWLRSYSLVGYVLCFSIGYGPISWLVMLEILPANIRGLTASLVTSFSAACFMISMTTLRKMHYLIDVSGCCCIYTAICVIGFVFAIICVPNTQGKSLQEIERKTTGRM